MRPGKEVILPHMNPLLFKAWAVFSGELLIPYSVISGSTSNECLTFWMNGKVVKDCPHQVTPGGGAPGVLIHCCWECKMVPMRWKTAPCKQTQISTHPTTQPSHSSSWNETNVHQWLRMSIAGAGNSHPDHQPRMSNHVTVCATTFTQPNATQHGHSTSY